MKQIAKFCYQKRRFVLIGWVLLLFGLFGLSSVIGGEYKTEFKLPGSESQAALDLLKERGVSERTGFPGQIVFKADQGVNDPAVRQSMESFFAAIKANVEDVSIVRPYAPESSYLIAADDKVAYAEINFSDRKQEVYLADAKEIKKLREAITLPGLQVELGGDIFIDVAEFSSEIIGIIAAVIILLIAFGSLLAMGLPIITALFGIGCGTAIITGFVTNVLSVPEATTQIAAMIGIGVGIDYALFVVTRYRQALHDGREPLGAVMLTLDTAGRAVVFAGLTVVIALLGMFMINLDFVRSISIGAVFAVLMTMLASITLLPAMLGFAGRNIDRFGLPHKTSAAEANTAKSFWYGWSRIIQGHPWIAFFASVAVLIVLAIPVFSLRLGFADAGNRGETDTTRRAYDLLSASFGQGFNGPILVIAEMSGDQDMAALGRLKTALESSKGVASATDPQIIGDRVALFSVFPTTAPQDEETADLVHRMRDQIIPASIIGQSPVVRLTGIAPSVADFSDYMSARLPIFFGAVLVLSFLLLLVIFHSVVVPLKAVVMNMLSIGASFGAIVAIFEWGFFADLIGLGKEGPVEAWAPMMLFAIIFGLSMDYEVFLLTRVREEYDKTGDNTRAVADGLASTGRVISAAAAIMICVFGAFILIPDRNVKLMGFGLAFAIFIDATVVRLILVPATMELLGKANWWAPKWLVKYLPVVHVSNPERNASHPAAAGSARSKKM
ncbi:MAG: MMPL family transporter [Dehalococcoidia bacterium]|nr:MMPL family transporter [Dehalococcoidia bacterium]